MKQLITAGRGISATVAFPPKQGTWDFLQQAHQETTSATIIGMIGPNYSAATVYILYGCNLYTGAGMVEYCSPGALFFNGEVYYLPAAVPVPPLIVPFVLLVMLSVSQYTPTISGYATADPVILTDSSSQNLHDIRSFSFTSGTSGTGTLSGTTASDWTNVVRINTPASVYSGSAGFNGQTVNFDHNNTYEYLGAGSSTNTITLNFTGAIVGKTITVVGAISAAQLIAFSVSGSWSNYVNASSLTAPSGCSYCIIQMTYMGNGSGRNTIATVINYI